MSYIFDMSPDMSRDKSREGSRDASADSMTHDEKNTWIYLAIAVVVPVVYAVVLNARGGGAEPNYEPLLIGAIAASIVLGIIGGIVLGAAGKARRDERDARISHTGDLVGFYVMSVAALVPLGLALMEEQHFFIANSLYAAFVLSAIVSSVVKIALYRRGF